MKFGKEFYPETSAKLVLLLIGL